MQTKFSKISKNCAKEFLNSFENNSFQTVFNEEFWNSLQKKIDLKQFANEEFPNSMQKKSFQTGSKG